MDRPPLITELRYKVDLSDWTDVLSYFCREATDEDKRIATKLNRLREEILIVYEKRRNLADELRSIRGIVVVVKATEFVTDTLRKDNAWVAQLREELQSVMGMAVPAKTAVFLEKMMEKQEGMESHQSDSDKEANKMAHETNAFLFKLMDEEPFYRPLSICDELRCAISSADWDRQFILYCQRAMGEDQRKMPEFIKETMNKDVSNLMKLQILGSEFELRAREKDLFIKKLKDCKQRVLRLPSSALVFSFPLALSCCSSIDSVAGADVDDGVPAI
nr:hypothetical protein [Tanacetum cinerariifolium]